MKSKEAGTKNFPPIVWSLQGQEEKYTTEEFGKIVEQLPYREITVVLLKDECIA